MQKIISSCILTENYPATTIAFQFTILELDSDIIQSMINCASLTLYKSDIASRCLPISITMFLQSGKEKRSSKSPADWIILDPTLAHIKNQQAYSHRITMTWNVDTQELISQSLVPLGKPMPLDFSDLELLTGLSLTCARNLHSFIIDL